MNVEERALRFDCDDQSLYGILSVPAQASPRGVLIVVGGPQYRVGSHRQFTLLARDLAAQGVPVMRFDYRGMGDSEGEARQFDTIEVDMRQALDQFFVLMPGLREVVIWGLCDGASAALFYAHRDVRVSGLVLVNPWARTDEGLAKAYLKHYYTARLFDRELWRKILRGGFDYRAAVRSVFRLAGQAVAPRKESAAANVPPLPARLADGFRRFQGKVLLILSGNDLTAQEFAELVKGSQDWQTQLRSSRVQRRDLPEANHTFSQRGWRDQVSSWTREWITSW
ncbi:MAG: hydrolase 1, exosortase A system-associated [Pseudomonadota bacterium]